MNKEKIYDEQVNPLMTQIIELCRKNGIAMVASFAIPSAEDPDIRCTTHLYDETGADPFAAAFRLLRFGRQASPLNLTTRDGDGNVTSMTTILG